jgi:hypothetical protein
LDLGGLFSEQNGWRNASGGLAGAVPKLSLSFPRHVEDFRVLRALKKSDGTWPTGN